jgi:hypothetical protein
VLVRLRALFTSQCFGIGCIDWGLSVGLFASETVKSGEILVDPNSEGKMWEQLLHYVGGDRTIYGRDSKEFRDCESAVCTH